MKQNLRKTLAQNDIDCWTTKNITPVPVETITKILILDTTSFVWRLLRNRLPTKDNLVQRRVVSLEDAVCVSGCGSQETATHLYLGCDIFGSLWSQVWLWLGISTASPRELRQHLTQFINMPGLHRSSHMFFRIIWFASVWILWKERNDCVFNNTVSTPFTLIEKVKMTYFLWLKSKQAPFTYSYHDWWKQPLLCMGVHL